MDGCVVCKLPSDLGCERCREKYCSIECQRTDWPYHKLICFPMPRLVKTVNSNSTPVAHRSDNVAIAVNTERNVELAEVVTNETVIVGVPADKTSIKRKKAESNASTSRDLKKRGSRYYKCVYCGRVSGISGLKDKTMSHMKNCKQKPSRANVKEDIEAGRVDKETFDKLPKIKRY